MSTDRIRPIKRNILPNPSYYSLVSQKRGSDLYNVLGISKYKKIRSNVIQYDLSISDDNLEKVLAALNDVRGACTTVSDLIKSLSSIKGVELQIIIRGKIYYLVAKNPQLDKTILINILHADKDNYVYSSIDKRLSEAIKTYSLQPIEKENLEKFQSFDRTRAIQVNRIAELYDAIENELGISIDSSNSNQHSTIESSEIHNTDSIVTRLKATDLKPSNAGNVSQSNSRFEDIKEGKER